MKKLYIDIGGTYLRSEVYTLSGSIEETVRSQEQDLLSYIDQKITDYPDIEFIGISYAGQVVDGAILSAPNIHIDEANIKEAVHCRYGIRLEIDNDLNCAVMAEAGYWQVHNIAALYVGTGLGSAVIDQGRLIRGNRNVSFEIGHIPYLKAPFVCGCGRDNCLELFSSGSGISKWLRHYGYEENIALEQLKNSDNTQLRNLVQMFTTAFLHAAGTLVTLANPQILVLGGGIVEKNRFLAEYLKEHIASVALSASLQSLRIEVTELKNAPLAGTKLLEVSRYG